MKTHFHIVWKGSDILWLDWFGGLLAVEIYNSDFTRRTSAQGTQFRLFEPGGYALGMKMMLAGQCGVAFFLQADRTGDIHINQHFLCVRSFPRWTIQCILLTTPIPFPIPIYCDNNEEYDNDYNTNNYPNNGANIRAGISWLLACRGRCTPTLPRRAVIVNRHGKVIECSSCRKIITDNYHPKGCCWHGESSVLLFNWGLVGWGVWDDDCSLQRRRHRIFNVIW